MTHDVVYHVLFAAGLHPYDLQCVISTKNINFKILACNIDDALTQLWFKSARCHSIWRAENFVQHTEDRHFAFIPNQTGKSSSLTSFSWKWCENVPSSMMERKKMWPTGSVCYHIVLRQTSSPVVCGIALVTLDTI